MAACCFAALDIDGNGALSKQEAAALPRLAGYFDELDADADGELGPSEFQGELNTPSQLGGGEGWSFVAGIPRPGSLVVESLSLSLSLS
ncbi:hypothetical protein [Thiohalocapsa sp. ML1]|uniref:hypothetical protein n=1 Tax=Thiohalocapsa sp. ML1 TaxID=1431688 RepID=UPI0007321927|nr:hypothetical protein [Thiohalocapsa sp. ML1]